MSVIPGWVQGRSLGYFHGIVSLAVEFGFVGAGVPDQRLDKKSMKFPAFPGKWCDLVTWVTWRHL